MTTVARAVLDVLGRAGVHTVFGLPGVHNLAFWRDAGGSPEIIVVRHEQTTVYAADGLARATGGLGVALTTTGPGAANAVGAFGEAAASGTPLLLIASEISTRPASTLARSSKSSTISANSAALSWMKVTCFSCSSVSGPSTRSSSSRVMLRIELIGVRNSWLM